MTPVRLESAAPRSRIKHSTTEPLGSPNPFCNNEFSHIYLYNKVGTVEGSDAIIAN